MPKLFFQESLECMSADEMHHLQEERFLKQIQHVWEHVPYYRNKMESCQIELGDVKSLEDIEKLPFLSKEDLRIAYPYGLCAVPKDECVRIHSTSGTTGKRVVAFYTQADLDLWEDCAARAIVAAGGTNEDIIQISYGYGLFTGGAGLNGGSHKIGAMTLPMSSGNTDRQLQFMVDLGSTILCCTPSYAAYLSEAIAERGIKEQIHLKSGIFGAEAWSEGMRKDIENGLGIKAYDIYGLTEISGPGVAFECECQNGMHINEDHFYPEIIDPDTGKVLPLGSQGELVFTCLTKKAFPLMRYRTRDICTLSRETCSCGRTLIKMSKPQGRSDDMLIIKGVNVFPSQIEQVLIEQGYPANYQLIVDRQNNTDSLEILVEMTQESFSDNLGAITVMEKKLVNALKGMLGIYANVRLVMPHSIERSEGKAVRIIDKRII